MRQSGIFITTGAVGIALGICGAVVKAASENQVVVIFLDEVFSVGWLDDPFQNGAFIFSATIYLSLFVFVVGIISKYMKH